jgi:hypothetical protein
MPHFIRCAKRPLPLEVAFGDAVKAAARDCFVA